MELYWYLAAHHEVPQDAAMVLGTSGGGVLYALTTPRTSTAAVPAKVTAVTPTADERQNPQPG